MNCMKCGREIPEGSVFCASCAAGPSAAQSGSAESAERKSILWIEQKLVQPTEQRLKRKKKILSIRRKLRAATVLLLICVVLLGGACFFAWSEHQKVLACEAQQEDLRVREGNLALREKSAAALEERNEELEGALSQSRLTIQSQEVTIQNLEQQNLTAIAERDDRIHSLTDETARLQTALETQHDSLTGEIGTLNETVRSLTDEKNRLQSGLTSAEAELKHWEETVVFFQQPGAWRYHNVGCTELDLSRSYSVFTPEDAVKAGLLPCEKCIH